MKTISDDDVFFLTIISKHQFENRIHVYFKWQNQRSYMRLSEMSQFILWEKD